MSSVIQRRTYTGRSEGEAEHLLAEGSAEMARQGYVRAQERRERTPAGEFVVTAEFRHSPFEASLQAAPRPASAAPIPLPAPAGSGPAFCYRCGSPRTPGAMFCSRCGLPLGTQPFPFAAALTPPAPQPGWRRHGRAIIGLAILLLVFTPIAGVLTGVLDLPLSGSGRIRFGTSLNETTLTVLNERTTFATTDTLAWAADLSRRAGTTSLRLVIAKRGPGSTERPLVDEPMTISNPDFNTSCGC